MSRRNENVRKALWEIDNIISVALKHIENGHYNLAVGYLRSIKSRTHRIKRTTWRGDIKCDCYKKVRKDKNFTKRR